MFSRTVNYENEHGSENPMTEQKTCPVCSTSLPGKVRFCTKCGKRFLNDPLYKEREKETLNLRILYIMVMLLVLGMLFPPWETAPRETLAYLGMHFIASPPEPGAVVSRLLQTVELVTIAIGGMYLSWLFRERPR